ncbi:MAG TPA: polysaccharide deacetylase family protein [Myxococcaceae bacterium]|nr:polysaccharide deacetylase family protein [Myxococcaceae bacterium]
MRRVDRRSVPVLVPQAGSLGSLGVIRSLGRAGYPVHACAESAGALGLHSRFVRTARVQPPPASGEFVPWVRDTVRTLGIRAIVPSELFLLGLRPALGEFRDLLPFFDPSLLELAFSKADLVSALEGDPRLPPSQVVEREVPPVEQLERLGRPLWLKADGVHGQAGAPSRVLRVDGATEARAELGRWLPHYRRLLVQGHVPGVGVGVFLLMVNGHPRARFAHRRLHEVPHTGGMSSFRESVRFPEMEAHALSVLRRIGWNGVAMLEYRRDPASGDFRLLELNARFWGSLHLALAAGVDFPRLLVDSWLGAREPEPSWSAGVRCRQTVPGELMHLWSVMRDVRVSRRDKLRTVACFAALSIDPRIHSDLWFPGDRALAVRETVRWAAETGTTVARRMRPRLKQSLYAGARATGLFRLSRLLTRDALRIVCWHGTSLAGEQRVFPGLFLSPDDLERRLLALHRYPVLPLEEAVHRLRAGTLPPAAVALTIDDGFFGTLRHGWPALQRHGFPATLYATTYHVQSGTPVFRLLVQWAFQQGREPVLELSQLGLGMVGTVRMVPGPERTEAMWRLIRHAEERMSEPERQTLADRVAAALGVDLGPVRAGRWLSLASAEELRVAAGEGLDVQLHTHRHRFPAARELALRELRDNRAVLEPVTGRALRHFCYPSGYFRASHLPWLEEAQVESATTCDPGMNRRGDSLLTLRRFLDSSERSQLEFEAELCGFSELLRRARALARRTRGHALRPEVPAPPGSEVPAPSEPAQRPPVGAVA